MQHWGGIETSCRRLTTLLECSQKRVPVKLGKGCLTVNGDKIHGTRILNTGNFKEYLLTPTIPWSNSPNFTTLEEVIIVLHAMELSEIRALLDMKRNVEHSILQIHAPSVLNQLLHPITFPVGGTQIPWS